MDAAFETWLEHPPPQQSGHPLVTLSYAQSLDGCLTVRTGQPTALSGAASRVLTHRLRAMHDAILVGIGTVLADDPKLNVRLFDGPDPRPVVLDTHLRIPDDCHLLARERNLPIIAAGLYADEARQRALEARGATVLRLPETEARVDLAALLAALCARGYRSVMVEGGARVITAFLAARLVDRAVITVAPVFLGGLHASAASLAAAADACNPDGLACVPVLAEPGYWALERDMIVWGQVLEQGV